MKTTNTERIKKIKTEITSINLAMQRLEMAEKAQYEARNSKDYDEAKDEARVATETMMNSLKEIVGTVSAIGCSNGQYEIHDYHKIIKLNLLDIIK